VQRNLLLVLFVMLALCAWSQTAPIELKVGVTEYQNIDRVYQSYLQFFHDVEIASDSVLHSLLQLELTTRSSNGAIKVKSILQCYRPPRLLRSCRWEIATTGKI
jgi:hypothetical protein